MLHLVEKNTSTFELEFTQQDTKTGYWDSAYKHPLRGFSLSYQDFGNKVALGQGYTAFAHTTFPIYQGEKFGFFDFRIGTGLAYVTKKYDVETNLKNNAIGSHWNGYVNLQFNWNKHYKNWHYGFGIEFGHYSNAAMKVPNLGLNVPSISLNLGYNIKERIVWEDNTKDQNEDEIIDKKAKLKDAFDLYVVGGVKQNVAKQYEPVFRPVIGLHGLYSKGLGSRWKLDIAADVIYNDANRHRFDTSTYSIGETFQFGTYVGGSIHAYKAEFTVGVGIYVWSPLKPFGLVYNRLGFRYHFTDKISGILGIKAHLGIADYLEFGIGYNFWKKK